MSGLRLEIPDEDDYAFDGGECPQCGGEGLLFGCMESCCSGADCDEFGCAPSPCDCTK